MIHHSISLCCSLSCSIICMERRLDTRQGETRRREGYRHSFVVCMHHSCPSSGTITRAEYVSGATTSRGVDGGCLCVFSDNHGLVLGLCYVLGGWLGVPEDIARRGVNVSGTTASDRKDFGLAAMGVRGTDTTRWRGAPNIAYPAPSKGLLCKVRLSEGQKRERMRLTKASRLLDTVRRSESAGVSVTEEHTHLARPPTSLHHRPPPSTTPASEPIVHKS